MAWPFWLLGVVVAIFALRAFQRLRVERVRLTLNGLRQPLKIVQLTDIHWDKKPIRITASFLDSAIEAANAESPDLILITGDFVQRDPAPVSVLASRFLSRLRARHGVFAVLGNHDHFVHGGAELISRELKEKAGITVLHNESAVVPGLGLELVGLGDLSSRHCAVERALKADDSLEEGGGAEEKERKQDGLASPPPTLPRVVLAHNPDSAALLRPYAVDLVLSGHTHGGQIALPFTGTPVLALPKKLLSRRARRRLPNRFQKLERVVKNWDWAVGLHRVPPAPEEEKKNRSASGFYLYTSRGLATHPPFRLFCDPEVTVFELSPPSPSSSASSSSPSSAPAAASIDMAAGQVPISVSYRPQEDAAAQPLLDEQL